MFFFRVTYTVSSEISGTRDGYCPSCSSRQSLLRREVTTRLLDVVPLPGGAVYDCPACKTRLQPVSYVARAFVTVPLVCLVALLAVGLGYCGYFAWEPLIGLVHGTTVGAPLLGLAAAMAGVGVVGEVLLIRYLVRLWAHRFVPLSAGLNPDL